jgi:hypothetical protein
MYLETFKFTTCRIKYFSDPGLWPQKISDNFRLQMIEAEPSGLEHMLKVTKTVPKDLNGNSVQRFCCAPNHQITEQKFLGTG